MTTGNLPPGIHIADWSEFTARFGTTPHRLRLLGGLKAALDALHSAGCQRVYIDGSFVTAKQAPGDFDGCWDVTGVDPTLLDPVLLSFANLRVEQKTKFGGELFLADAMADPAGTRFLAFFQRDKQTGQPKGIVAIELGSLP